MRRLDSIKAYRPGFLAVFLSGVTLLVLLGLIGLAALFHAQPAHAAQTDDTSDIAGLDWTLTLTGPEQPVVKGSTVTYEATLTCSGANGSFSDFDLTVTGLDVPEGGAQPTTQDGGYKLVYTGTANTVSTANDEAGKAISATASVAISYEDPPGTPQTRDLTATIKIHVVDLTSAGGQLEYFASGTYEDDLAVGYMTNSFYEVTATNPTGFENTAGLWAYEVLDNDNLDDQGKPTFVSSDDEYEFTQMGFTTNGNYIVRFFGDVADDEGAKNMRWNTGEPKDDIDVTAFDITSVQGKLPTQLDSQYSSSFIIATGDTPEYFITTSPAGCETELSVRIIDVTDPDNETFVTSSSADNVWNASGEMDFAYTFDSEGTYEVRFYQDANGNGVIDTPDIPPNGEVMDYCTATVSDTVAPVDIVGHGPGTTANPANEVPEDSEDDPANLQVITNLDDDDASTDPPDLADDAIGANDDDLVQLVLHPPGTSDGALRVTWPSSLRLYSDSNSILEYSPGQLYREVSMSSPPADDPLEDLAGEQGTPVTLWAEGVGRDDDAVVKLSWHDDQGTELDSDKVHILVRPTVLFAFYGDTVSVGNLELKPEYADGTNGTGDAYIGTLDSSGKVLTVGQHKPPPEAENAPYFDAWSAIIRVKLADGTWSDPADSILLVTGFSDPDQAYLNELDPILSSDQPQSPETWDELFEFYLSEKYDGADPSIEELEAEAFELRQYVYGGRSWEWFSGRAIWTEGTRICVEDSVTPENAADLYYNYLKNDIVGTAKNPGNFPYMLAVVEYKRRYLKLVGADPTIPGRFLARHWQCVMDTSDILASEYYAIPTGFLLQGVLGLKRAKDLAYMPGPRNFKTPLVRRNWFRGRWVEHDTIVDSLGYAKNTTKVSGVVDGNTVKTIPDVLRPKAVVDIKDVRRLYNLKQLRAQVHYAVNNGRKPVVIVTNRVRKITQTVADEYQQHGGAIFKRNVSSDTYSKYNFTTKEFDDVTKAEVMSFIDD